VLRPAEPHDAALGRRRVRGLRRDEVAALANIGLSWYTMLEQGRVENVSPRTLLAVARALRLSGTERQHLSALAGSSPPNFRDEIAQSLELPSFAGILASIGAA
jgi:transcriptional regulator with XRE-family HTH domain